MNPEFLIKPLAENTSTRIKETITTRFNTFKSTSSEIKDILNANLKLPEMLLAKELDNETRSILGNKLSQSYALSALEAQKLIADVPIVESMERMVNLQKFLENNVEVVFSKKPYHPACGDWANKERLFWVRESFANKIITLFQGLNNVNITPKIEDTYRPPGVQEGLFSRRYHLVKADFPKMTEEELINEVMSKTAATPRLSSHKAGAAMDYTMLDSKTKIPLKIGNNYPDGGPHVSINFPYLTEEEWINRQFFLLSAISLGLSVYPWENWHISYNDNLSGYDSKTNSRIKNFTATYGPIKEFDHENGTIMHRYSLEEYDQTFKINYEK